MPFPKGKKIEVNPQEDVKDDDVKEESEQLKKTKRSKDDVKKIFKESYLKKNGIDPKDPKVIESGIVDKLDSLLDDLTDRELANSRNMSKVIGQKIKFREQVQGKKTQVQNEEDEEDEDDGDINDIQSFRDNERKKAINKFLPRVVKEFKDEGLTVEGVYKKLDKFYAEEKTDTRREDFMENLENAFRAAYPDLAEERKKRKEAEEDNEEVHAPIIGGGGHQKKKKQKVDRSDLSKRGSRKIKNLGDWFKGKD